MSLSSSEPRTSGYCAQNNIFFEDAAYVDIFLEASRQLVGKPLSPAVLLDRWAALIKQIETGYNASPPELEYALSEGREPIDELLMDADLQAFPDHRKFIRVVGQLDNKFMELTFEAHRHPEDFAWFGRRIPRKAGPQYIDFLSGDLKKKD